MIWGVSTQGTDIPAELCRGFAVQIIPERNSEKGPKLHHHSILQQPSTYIIIYISNSSIMAALENFTKIRAEPWVSIIIYIKQLIN